LDLSDSQKINTKEKNCSENKNTNKSEEDQTNNNINERKNIDEINGFSSFKLNNIINKNTMTNTVDIFQTQNYSELNNNYNINNINIINNKNSFPSFININNINGQNNINNNLYNKSQTNKNILDINNNKNINNFIFNNINMEGNYYSKNIKNINNYNNINIGNIIQTINPNYNNMNVGISNENINNFISTDFNQILAKTNTISNNEVNKIYSLLLNKMNEENNLNDSDLNLKKIKSNNFSSFVGEKNDNAKNGKTSIKINKNNYKNKNGTINKENMKIKEIRDFKNFCDGLNCSLPEYICSQTGSRLMQKYLYYFPTFVITNLIEKIYMDLEKIMCDIYGNYFCQKLYIISSTEQRRMILNSMKDIFVRVSKTSSGAHVAQSIIEESLTKEEKKIIMDYIKGHEMEMALHQEGTHVLQKVIQIFPESERQSLTDVLCNYLNVSILCRDIKGISVIKRLISFNTEKMNKLKLVESFYVNCLEISKSSSGSYIMQYLIEQWGIDISLKLVYVCITNFEAFATCRHSANLIDKIILICLKKYSFITYFGSNDNINYINNEIIIINALKSIILEPNKILNVYKNKYGKTLVIKIRKLFSIEENKKLYFLIKYLETVPNYLENKRYQMYNEIFRSQ
jgi:hypothetical protein